MKSSVENLSETRVKLTVEIPFEDLQDSLKKAYQRIGSQVNVPGFRRGKVPARIIDQRFGRGAVLEEVVSDQVPKAYDTAIAENSLKPMGQPEVEVTQIEDGEIIAFTAEVDITPQFDLPEYKGLLVEVKDSEVTDAEVEEQIEQLQKRFASTTPVERAAVNGDLVLVDVKGELDGDELEDFAGSALTFEMGADGLIEGFTEAVLGTSEGDTVTFEHTPEEGPHTGKAISVTVDVKGVRERTLPAVDDEFAMLASEFDTVDELRADLRTKLQGNRLVEQAYEAREKLAEKLLEIVEFPLPEHFLQAQVDEHFADGHGDEEHRAQVADETRTQLKTQLILDAIADAEEMQVGQGELIQWLIQQAPRYGMSPDQFASALAEAGQVASAMLDVRRGKALAFVMEEADIRDASGNPVDITPLDEDEDELDDEYEEYEDEDLEDDDLEETVEDEVVDEALDEALDAIDAKMAESRDTQ